MFTLKAFSLLRCTSINLKLNSWEVNNNRNFEGIYYRASSNKMCRATHACKFTERKIISKSFLKWTFLDETWVHLISLNTQTAFLHELHMIVIDMVLLSLLEHKYLGKPSSLSEYKLHIFWISSLICAVCLMCKQDQRSSSITHSLM